MLPVQLGRQFERFMPPVIAASRVHASHRDVSENGRVVGSQPPAQEITNKWMEPEPSGFRFTEQSLIDQPSNRTRSVRETEKRCRRGRVDARWNGRCKHDCPDWRRLASKDFLREIAEERTGDPRFGKFERKRQARETDQRRPALCLRDERAYDIW
ncbi:MAG TPA: hypothetical protein VHF67_06805 [Gaiellaceae bacterium]|nr:hypothetical protein [Gaiellaceae bacterium]